MTSDTTEPVGSVQEAFDLLVRRQQDRRLAALEKTLVAALAFGEADALVRQTRGARRIHDEWSAKHAIERFARPRPADVTRRDAHAALVAAAELDARVAVDLRVLYDDAVEDLEVASATLLAAAAATACEPASASKMTERA